MHMFLSYLLTILFSVPLIVFYGVHMIDEGYVGVYYRGGALLDTTSRPGYHFMLPYLTSVKMVQITTQTDLITNVPCGTSGGVLVYFERIEVVNILESSAGSACKKLVLVTVRDYTVDYDKTLIFDKIHHELNQIKKDQIDDSLKLALEKSLQVLAPGLKILSVRVTKPKIPDIIKEKYIEMESEKTKLLVAQQHQFVVEKEAEIEKNKAIILAETKYEIMKISLKEQVLKKETEQKIQEISNEIELHKTKKHADGLFYANNLTAAANKILLTKEYLELQRINGFSQLHKVYFGEKIPNIFLPQPNLKNFNDTE